MTVSKNKIAARSIIPMAQVYTKTPFFLTRLALRRVWVKEPRHSGNVLAEMCHLYRRTRPPIQLARPAARFVGRGGSALSYVQIDPPHNINTLTAAGEELDNLSDL